MKISVIIPAYNREKTIEKAIASVLRQTVMPIEIIVVDDCSTDATVSIVRRIRRESNLVRLLLLNKNEGAQVARNIGIQEAKGDWVAFLDSDDEWIENKLELQRDAVIKNPDFDVYYGDYYVRKNGALHYKKCLMSGSDGNYFQNILFDSRVLFQGMFVRKSALEDIRGLGRYVPSYQEWDTNIRLSVSHKYYYINKPLFIYNLHSGETISKDKKKKILGFQYVVIKNYKLFLKSDVAVESILFYYKGMYLRYRECKDWFALYYLVFWKGFSLILRINFLRLICELLVWKRWKYLSKVLEDKMEKSCVG